MRVVPAATFATLIAVACGGGTSSGPAPRTTIHLARNSWYAAQLDDAVAEILLTEKLGLGVELVDIDEYAQWDEIARGDLDASLEVWPSGHASDVQTYVATGRVENAGLLGPVGKIGWYVPSFVLEQHPELSTWDGLKIPANAQLFVTPATMASGKGQFLAGDPSWTQYDGQIIQNLGLKLQVVTSGSEAATLEALDQAYSQRMPILFYFWLPHYAFVKYDLANVALPPYSDACWGRAGAGGVDCDYPTDRLFKIVWPGLRAASPRAYALLTAMTLTTADQLEMLESYAIRGLTLDDAARAWIDAHPDKWTPWVGPIPIGTAP
jgi:glycine betaine/proline transport system substrate-binding protein